MGENISENNNTLELKSIASIKDEKFIIPSFQRGYRWEPVQVITLLEDIKEYIEKANDIKTFMCLQPVVFYSKDNKLDGLVVIDGQQRLTTMALITYYLKNELNYTISYEKNNKTLDDILKDMLKNINRENIDKHIDEHINNNNDDDIKNLSEQLKENDDINISLENYFKTLDIKHEDSEKQKIYYKILLFLTKCIIPQKCLLDEYHIILAYLTIKFYFAQNDTYKTNFNILFNSTSDDYSIKFIWYNVTEDINSDEKKAIDIFTRLNIGKIPLTDAELIKALFLKQDNFKESELDKKLHIAYKWDEIEKTLNNDSFWYFICNKKEEDDANKRNRIELILKLAVDIDNDNQYKLFKKYEEILKGKSDSEEFSLEKHGKPLNKILYKLWNTIEECFMTLKEWYNDNEMYHYIGYLICSGKQIENIYNIRNKNNDSHITNISRQVFLDISKCNNPNIFNTDTDIYNIINNIINNIKSYNYYDSDKKDIKNILLFSNIYETIMSNKAATSNKNTTTTITHRFPFDLFVKQKFDIEHIAPQTENPLNEKKERIEWFIESYKYLDEKNLFQNFINDTKDKNISNELIKNINDNLTLEAINKITECDKDNYKNIKNIIFDDDKWYIVYNYILKMAENNDKNIPLQDEEHKLGNLILLPSDINRRYKNALFGVKRKHIIKDETEDCRFIPVVTKHAFLKYYSDNTKNLWTKQDAIQFKIKIISNLKSFFKQFSKKEDSNNEYK